MKNLLLTLLSLVCTLIASAELPSLPPGGTVTPSGVRFSNCPDVGGGVIRDALIDFEVRHSSLDTVLLTGRLQDRVVRNSSGNLVYSPRLRDLESPNGTAWIDEVVFTGFEGMTLRADYRVDGLGQVAPNTISRSSNGDTITVSHGNSLIVPPEEQRFIQFLSTETDFDLTGTVRITVRNDFGAGAFTTTIQGTAARPTPPPPALPPVEEIKEQLPQVILNQLIYQEGEAVTAEVRYHNASQIDTKRQALVYCSDSTGDMEIVALQATNDPLVFVTESPLTFVAGGSGQTSDAKLAVNPGEIFIALLTYQFFDNEQTRHDSFSSDWGLAADPEPEVSLVEVREGLALTSDELNPSPGAKPLGTLFFEGDVGPVQVASKELMFFPKDEEQLNNFLERTSGKIVNFEGHSGEPIDGQTNLPKPGEAWLTIELAGDPAKIGALPQLRALVGEQKTLSASNRDTLALVATAMELWSEGYLVGLNPRMQLQGSSYWPEALVEDADTGVSERIDSFGNIGRDSLNALMLRDERFGFRQSWAFLEMFDYDQRAIPVGVIDSGFAPNPDFKTGHALYSERNLSNGTSGIGSARVPQEVGNSFFGDKAWHGNGSVTTICGVGGNRFGTAGIAAPTAVPKLYHMGLANFALGFGSAIRLAVDDGCSVINISAGYPCRVLSVLGNDDICSVGGRAAFAAKLGFAVRAAAAAACAASGVLDFFLPGLGAAVCASAIVTAETAAAGLFGSLFLGETRGPVERGVAYATSRGVPIVASAGNRISDEAIGALGAFVNNENSNIDDWQVIPAVIQDVIAVGACHPWDENRWDGSGRNFYANLQFWGDSVDIWAPIFSHYYAPENGNVNPTADDVPIRRTFGGTSNAAPVIAGVIANMMAVDPSLDRRFSAPATHSGIPSRIRNTLVNCAYQAGDPEAPDSADDRTLMEWNPDTEEFEEIAMPPELVLDLQRRRNYVNAWKTLRELARGRGLLEYEALGYHTDLGRSDAYSDIAAPDGVIEPLLPFPADLNDELTTNDQEFWYHRLPSRDRLYRANFTVTIPRSENPDAFFINGARGALTSTTADEQTLRWESGDRWPGAVIETLIRGADTPYKMSTLVTSRQRPPADEFDRERRNDTVDTASEIEGWERVPPAGGLEVDAWQLCVEDLNIHRENDIDCFRIEFPSELGIPFSCGGLDPWITIKLAPENTAASIRVFSLNGGEETLLARGNAGRSLRIDCREYFGRLPLYVCIESRSFIEYDLKVRWSIPSQELCDRLKRIREAHAGGREAPSLERFFPPRIEEFLGSIGGVIPDSVVNPNPAVQQPLDQQGRYLFSSLLRVDVPAGRFG